jgi:Flp pilus assembly pilin Flp
MHITAPRTTAATVLERGASLVEYALLIAGLAAVCLIGLRFLGGDGEAELTAAGNAIAGHTSPAAGGGSGGGAPGTGGGGSAGSGGGGGSTAGSDQAEAEKAAAEAKASAEAEQAAADKAAEEAAKEDDEPETAVTASDGSGKLYWWDSKAGEGEWVASTTFTNAWERPAYLTVEVTRVMADGKTSKDKVQDLYVPAKGSADFAYWNNAIDTDSKSSDDVVAVRFEVVQIKTSDLDWKPRTYSVHDGAMSTAIAPSVK